MSNPNIHFAYFGEDPHEFLHETSPLAQKIGEREGLSAWHDNIFIPTIKASVERSLKDHLGGDIEGALQTLSVSKECWTLLNDDLREAISEIPHVNRILGRDDIEKSLLHESANGLNDLVKSYVNACLLLIQADQIKEDEVAKEETDIPFNVAHIVTNPASMSPVDFEQKLLRSGFTPVRQTGSGAPHKSYEFIQGGRFLGKISIPFHKTEDFRPPLIARLKRYLKEIARKGV